MKYSRIAQNVQLQFECTHVHAHLSSLLMHFTVKLSVNRGLVTQNHLGYTLILFRYIYIYIYILK